ncbi:hypothetical protein M758_UG166600 [Ceratodon purpureus]|nr:hypothetical protein M758_UG166600 [Ceratodon purpureus]
MGQSRSPHGLEVDDFDPWDSNASSQGSCESLLLQPKSRLHSKSTARYHPPMAFPARMSQRLMVEGRHDDGGTLEPISILPSSWSPELASGQDGISRAWHSTNPVPTCDMQSIECRKRNASRDFLRSYLKEMAAAHAENREPNVQIPVDSFGKVLGLRSPWH